MVTTQTQVRDRAAVDRAAARLGGTVLGVKEHLLYSRQSATGLGVKLPGWTYPVVFDTDTGAARFDNYEGQWGEQKVLDKFLELYAAEVIKAQAAALGMTVTETELAGGGLELVCEEV